MKVLRTLDDWDNQKYYIITQIFADEENKCFVRLVDTWSIMEAPELKQNIFSSKPKTERNDFEGFWDGSSI